MCPRKLMQCERCPEEVPREEMATHIRDFCAERDTTCPYGQFGCPDQVKHYDLEEHLETNKERHIKLMGVKLVQQKEVLEKFTKRLQELEGQVMDQNGYLKKYAEMRQAMEKQIQTYEMRQNEYNRNVDRNMRSLANDAAYDAKKKADNTQYDARTMISGIQREVRKVGVTDLQALKRDVASVKSRLG